MIEGESSTLSTSSAKGANGGIDDVAHHLIVEVIDVLFDFGARDDGSAAKGEEFEKCVFPARATAVPSRRTVLAERSISRGPIWIRGFGSITSRRGRASTLASSSSKSKGFTR